MGEGEGRDGQAIEVRPLTTVEEFDRCLDLQRKAFGLDDVDLMPNRLLVVLNHIGGLVLGAWDGDRLAGFLNMMPGIRYGAPYWHSHMLAVLRNYWNCGVGTQLKLAQREYGLRRGIRLIEWTFDPLESKNAYLNIEKLGVVVHRYYVNFYGQTTGALQRGLESDRLVAEWWLEKPRISVTGETRRVVIPADLQSLKKQDLAAARVVQLRVRAEFLRNAKDGFFVVALERKGSTSEYVFIRGPERAYPTD
jgi:predicted GNAT superfamily acetyltransferase